MRVQEGPASASRAGELPSSVATAKEMGRRPGSGSTLGPTSTCTPLRTASFGDTGGERACGAVGTVVAPVGTSKPSQPSQTQAWGPWSLAGGGVWDDSVK